MNRYKVVVLAATLFLFCGCEDLFIFNPESSSDNTGQASVSIKGPLLAKVDGWAIGLDDFKQRLDALKTMVPEDQRGQELGAQDKKNVLQELVNLQILAKVAEEKGINKDKDVKEAVDRFRDSLLVQKLRENIVKDVVVTDVEIKNFYDTNKAAFQKPEERKVREIVVNSESQAKNILIQLLQGESFSLLARSNSITDSSSQGGDLGYLNPNSGEKFQKFWEVVFTTDKGENSNYFKGPKGYYLIKVEDVRGGQVKPLSEVRDQVRQYLKTQKVQSKIEDMIFKAKQRIDVTINDYLFE